MDKGRIRETILFICNPLFIVAFLMAFTTVYYHHNGVDFNTSETTSSQIYGKFVNNGSLVQDWCVYTYKNGTTQQKLLETFDISKPGYENIELKAVSECS